jgi:hypothetical protein
MECCKIDPSRITSPKPEKANRTRDGSGVSTIENMGDRSRRIRKVRLSHAIHIRHLMLKKVDVFK